MATNYPAGLDTTASLPVRSSGNTISSSDNNDKNAALIALETKIGVGDSNPNVPGRVLTVQDGAGTTGWSDLPAASGVQSVVAGTNVTIDATDPANPIVSAAGATGGGGGGGGAAGWTLVDHASMTTGHGYNYHVTGLDGNTDRMYKIYYCLYSDGTDAVLPYFNFYHDRSPTSYFQTTYYEQAFGTVRSDSEQYSANSLNLLGSDAKIARHIVGEMTIHATTGRARLVMMDVVAVDGPLTDSAGLHAQGVGFWDDTSTNITEMSFWNMSGPDLMGDIWIYKPA